MYFGTRRPVFHHVDFNVELGQGWAINFARGPLWEGPR